MVQGFYERKIKKKDSYITTLDDIGLWIDGKLNNNSYGLGLGGHDFLYFILPFKNV